jgi:hypothetical protein
VSASTVTTVMLQLQQGHPALARMDWRPGKWWEHIRALAGDSSRTSLLSPWQYGVNGMFPNTVQISAMLLNSTSAKASCSPGLWDCEVDTPRRLYAADCLIKGNCDSILQSELTAWKTGPTMPGPAHLCYNHVMTAKSFSSTLNISHHEDLF